MDPNAALAQLRDQMRALDQGGGNVDTVVDLFTGLDEWLTSGGFKPDAWSQWDESLRLRRPPQ